jgi:hypothetical protein
LRFIAVGYFEGCRFYARIEKGEGTEC